MKRLLLITLFIVLALPFVTTIWLECLPYRFPVESSTQVVTSPNGWTLINPPPNLDLEAVGVPGLFTVSVKTRSILNDASLSTVHPLVQNLNTYWEVTAHPVPAKVAFNGQVLIEGQSNTANTLTTPLSAAPKAQLIKETSWKYRLPDIYKTMTASAQLIPITLMCFPAVPYSVGEIYKHSQQQKQAIFTKQQTLLFHDKALPKSTVWHKEMTHLQQTFNMASDDFRTPDPVQGVFRILPSKDMLGFNVPGKEIKFLDNYTLYRTPFITFRFRVIQPVSIAQVSKTLNQYELETDVDTDFDYEYDTKTRDRLRLKNLSGVSIPNDKIYLTSCTMGLGWLFKSVNLRCLTTVDTSYEAQLPSAR